MVAIRSDNGILNFYPRPPRGGRRDALEVVQILLQISIHALREEGDGRRCSLVVVGELISIHALREEGDISCKGG